MKAIIIKNLVNQKSHESQFTVSANPSLVNDLWSHLDLSRATKLPIGIYGNDVSYIKLLAKLGVIPEPYTEWIAGKLVICQNEARLCKSTHNSTCYNLSSGASSKWAKAGGFDTRCKSSWSKSGS